ncbi:MAG: ribosome biogenesis protein tsr3 [Watsoniomyces obsoletus]|nr:MAG: ribosome biogenesis protein tsr3 [Watsoniomyces obsoletus]
MKNDRLHFAEFIMSCRSVCVFCAHRDVAQGVIVARQTVQTQRRYLHAAKAVAGPAEATAVAPDTEAERPPPAQQVPGFRPRWSTGTGPPGDHIRDQTALRPSPALGAQPPRFAPGQGRDGMLSGFPSPGRMQNNAAPRFRAPPSVASVPRYTAPAPPAEAELSENSRREHGWRGRLDTQQLQWKREKERALREQLLSMDRPEGSSRRSSRFGDWAPQAPDRQQQDARDLGRPRFRISRTFPPDRDESWRSQTSGDRSGFRSNDQSQQEGFRRFDARRNGPSWGGQGFRQNEHQHDQPQQAEFQRFTIRRVGSTSSELKFRPNENQQDQYQQAGFPQRFDPRHDGHPWGHGRGESSWQGNAPRPFGDRQPGSAMPARPGGAWERMQTSNVEEQSSEPSMLSRLSDRARESIVGDQPYLIDRGGPKKPRRRQKYDRQEEDEDEGGGGESFAERRRRRKEEKKQRRAAAILTPITIPEYISVGALASRLKVRLEDFMRKLSELGYDNLSYDYILNGENAGLIASEYRYEPVLEKIADEDDLNALPEIEDRSTLPSRPPVVTIMGHVDHGKTTILDYLRKSAVAASEHGGITQHIGAFSVTMPSGKIITFLDTPGHEAFLSMRRRGANVTDIVILAVAADDSVKPQTIEAIKHAKSAKVPMIVAINKIDKPEADAERVKRDLARHGVEVEDIGGDTQAICVSGKTGAGMTELEDATVTLSEVLDLRADPEGRCEGWVLESATKRAGRMATILVRRGTLFPGDILVAGSTWTRVRTLKDSLGVEIESAGPGTPVEIDGWKELPDAGTEVLECPDEAKAKSVVAFRSAHAERLKMISDVEAVNEVRRAEQQRREEEEIRRKQDERDGNITPPTNTTTPADEGATTTEYVPFIIKADVHGSVEAVEGSISNLGNDMVRPKILRAAAGPVTEFDIELANAAKGVILAFNTKIDPSIFRLAETSGVPILEHTIIYHLTDDVISKLSEKLPPLITQRVTGEAEVAEIFEIKLKRNQTQKIAGCKVRNGSVHRNSKLRVLRSGETLYEGGLISLKNSKKDVMEMKKGMECGVAFADDWSDFREGDLIQCFEEKREKRYF